MVAQPTIADILEGTTLFYLGPHPAPKNPARWGHIAMASFTVYIHRPTLVVMQDDFYAWASHLPALHHLHERSMTIREAGVQVPIAGANMSSRFFALGAYLGYWDLRFHDRLEYAPLISRSCAWP